jgi:hypothetical protein
MSTLEINTAIIEAYESDAIRHEREGRHRIASIYRAAAHRKRIETRAPLLPVKAPEPEQQPKPFPHATEITDID